MSFWFGIKDCGSPAAATPLTIQAITVAAVRCGRVLADLKPCLSGSRDGGGMTQFQESGSDSSRSLIEFLWVRIRLLPIKVEIVDGVYRRQVHMNVGYFQSTDQHADLCWLERALNGFPNFLCDYHHLMEQVWFQVDPMIDLLARYD